MTTLEDCKGVVVSFKQEALRLVKNGRFKKEGRSYKINHKSTHHRNSKK